MPRRLTQTKQPPIKSGQFNHTFLQKVGEAVADAGAILITGPANEKTELVKHIERHLPTLRRKIVGVETVDHPTDGELVAYARKHFASDHQVPPRTKT